MDKVALTILLAMLLTACPASQSPIGPRSEAIDASRLSGTWELVSTQDWEFRQLHIYEDDDNTFVVVALAEVDWATLSGHISALGSRWFANLSLRDGSKDILDDAADVRDSHPFWFCAIRFDDQGRLEVGLMIEPLDRALDAGLLRGRSGSQQYGTLVSDTSANIVATLSTFSDDVLFEDALIYRRIPWPAATPP